MKPDFPKIAVSRPESAVSYAVGAVGLCGLVLWVLIARYFGDIAATFGLTGMPARLDGPHSALMCVAFTAVPMILWSLFVDKVHKRPSTGLNWSLKRPVADILDVSMVKISGLWATWALIAVVYATFRFWWNQQFANFPFSMGILQQAALPLLIASIPYVLWLDRHLVDPKKDGAWHFGAWIAGKDGWQAEEIFHHLRAWAVKGFFLAFMISITPAGFSEIVNMDWAKAATQPAWLAGALIGAMFMVDVQFATLGYMLTLKPLDAHIRTAQPTLAGWMAAMICYPPLIQMNNGGPLDYHVATSEWSYWLSGNNALLWAWGCILVALTIIYAWATVAFGIRFSNLTHRGILTHGPFMITKHPAYFTKNIFWWLSAMPFLVTNGSFVDAARNTALLACVSGVYYWRAKTEERHLGSDPAYQAYADWMEIHGPVPRFFGWMKSLLGRRAQSGTTVPAFQPAE